MINVSYIHCVITVFRVGIVIYSYIYIYTSKTYPVINKNVARPLLPGLSDIRATQLWQYVKSIMIN